MRHYLINGGVFLCTVHFLCTICAPENKKPTTAMVIGCIVETAGFEPASKGPDTNVSTCVVYRSISHHARR